MPLTGGAAGAVLGGVAGGVAGNSDLTRILGAGAGALLGGGAGTLIGKLREKMLRERYLNTAKHLKGVGVLTPDHLRMAAPMLRHNPNYRMIM